MSFYASCSSNTHLVHQTHASCIFTCIVHRAFVHVHRVFLRIMFIKRTLLPSNTCIVYCYVHHASCICTRASCVFTRHVHQTHTSSIKHVHREILRASCICAHASCIVMCIVHRVFVHMHRVFLRASCASCVFTCIVHRVFVHMHRVFLRASCASCVFTCIVHLVFVHMHRVFLRASCASYINTCRDWDALTDDFIALGFLPVECDRCVCDRWGGLPARGV